MNHLRTKSEALFARGQAHIPGGVNSPVRAAKAVGTFPLFIHHGQGARIYDVDGNEYVDVFIADHSAFCGHAPGPVVSERQLAQADFYVDYVHARQRGLTPRSLQGRTPDATVTIGGVDYARIYRLR